MAKKPDSPHLGIAQDPSLINTGADARHFGGHLARCALKTIHRSAWINDPKSVKRWLWIWGVGAEMVWLEGRKLTSASVESQVARILEEFVDGMLLVDEAHNPSSSDSATFGAA